MVVLKQLLGSKKFIALLVGLLASVITPLLISQIGMDPAEATAFAAGVSTKIAAMVSAYMVGQGLADNGKEKAKIEAAAEALIVGGSAAPAL